MLATMTVAAVLILDSKSNIDGKKNTVNNGG